MKASIEPVDKECDNPNTAMVWIAVDKKPGDEDKIMPRVRMWIGITDYQTRKEAVDIANIIVKAVNKHT